MDILELHNLDRYYGKTKVLDGLCVHVPKGKIYGFLGRNGAGKTTTIRIILGLIRSHGGQVRINGEACAGPYAASLGRTSAAS